MWDPLTAAWGVLRVADGGGEVRRGAKIISVKKNFLTNY